MLPGRRPLTASQSTQYTISPSVYESVEHSHVSQYKNWGLVCWKVVCGTGKGVFLDGYVVIVSLMDMFVYLDFCADHGEMSHIIDFANIEGRRLSCRKKSYA